MSKADPIALRNLLAKNVRLIRHQLGWNQEQLAEEAGLHRTYIGSIERAERNISIDNIGRLAQALRVNPKLLLSEDIK